MTFLPREPLGYFQKRKLEKQFREQVPEFSQLGKKKYNSENLTNFFSLLTAGGFGISVHSKSFQPLAGVFAGVVGFAGAKLFFQTFSPTIFGLNKTKNDEFETAFNTWVYYKNELEKKQ
eukprot:gene10355-2769_t